MEKIHSHKQVIQNAIESLEESVKKSQIKNNNNLLSSNKKKGVLNGNVSSI